ncbi:MAG: hypothetical protein K8S16_19470 [Bacteroidales bacterium]|nr:hypothetical protein [Bacteroidales bacterium]
MKKPIFPKIDLIKGSILITLIIYIILNITYFNKSKIFYGDSLTYYAYLPALFVHNDVTLEFAREDPQKYNGKMFHLVEGPNGNYVIKTSSGMAIAVSPFFLLAHGYASLTIHEANGFTKPYKLAVMLSVLVYILLGLTFLGKILKRYYSELTVGITILIVGIGTNLLCFSTIQAGVSHAFSFVFLIFYIYLVIKWYEKQSIKTTILLGLVGGFIVLIRPSNILILIILIFYNVNTFKDLKDRFLFFIKNYWLILIMVFFSILPWIPQFMYWKEISGQYVFNSYFDGQVNWDKPQTIKQLFGYRKGWLVYSPLMSLTLIGLYFLYKRNKKFFWSTSIFLVLNIYFISSYYSWWFGGGFGIRAYIDSYAMFTFPIAAITEKIVKSNKKIIAIYFAVLLWFFTLNIVQTIQYAHGYIHLIAMTKEAYWAQFMRFSLSENYNDYLLYPNYKNARKGISDPRLDYTYEEYLMLKNDSIIGLKMEVLRGSEKYMEMIQEKAVKKGVSLEQMLWYEAQWIIEYELDRSKEQKILEDAGEK